MVNKSNHPDRTDLLKAIRAGKSTYQGHLNSCQACRLVNDLLVRVWNRDELELEQPSEESLARLTQIPLMYKSRTSPQVSKGNVTEDSWRGRAPIDIRDVTFGHVRRVKLKAGKISLEFVAERRETDWTFVARVYEGGKVSSDYVLSVGRRKLLSKSQGFYFWDSKRPPGKISLLGDKSIIEFERLRWS